MADKQARISEIRKKIRTLNIQNSKRQAWQIGTGAVAPVLGGPLAGAVLHPTLSHKRRQAEKEIRELEAELRELTGNTLRSGASYSITGSGTDYDRKLIINGQDGKTYTFDMSHAKSGTNDGYKANNARYGATMHDVTEAFIGLMTDGRIPTAADLGVNPKEYDVIMEDVRTMATRNGITLDENYNIADGFDTSLHRTESEQEEYLEANAQEDAFNKHYTDLYSLEDGTGGKATYDRFEEAFKNRAMQEATLADAQYQQAAILQAEKVKQITDQVRAERMTRLRAGMSESQIANQDMQMLMANVGALNDQAQALNEGRLQAQLGYNTAQDQAYEAYLNQANQQAQVASSIYASQVADINYQAEQYLKRQGIFNPTQSQRDDAVRLFSTGSKTDANAPKKP